MADIFQKVLRFSDGVTALGGAVVEIQLDERAWDLLSTELDRLRFFTGGTRRHGDPVVINCAAGPVRVTRGR